MGVERAIEMVSKSKKVGLLAKDQLQLTTAESMLAPNSEASASIALNNLFSWFYRLKSILSLVRELLDQYSQVRIHSTDGVVKLSLPKTGSIGRLLAILERLKSRGILDGYQAS